MPVSVEDADECQHCEDADATEKIAVTLGGQSIGWAFVCGECADELAGDSDV